jgi:hypothetical protein
MSEPTSAPIRSDPHPPVAFSVPPIDATSDFVLICDYTGKEVV